MHQASTCPFAPLLKLIGRVRFLQVARNVAGEWMDGIAILTLQSRGWFTLLLTPTDHYCSLKPSLAFLRHENKAAIRRGTHTALLASSYVLHPIPAISFVDSYNNFFSYTHKPSSIPAG